MRPWKGAVLIGFKEQFCSGLSRVDPSAECLRARVFSTRRAAAIHASDTPVARSERILPRQEPGGPPSRQRGLTGPVRGAFLRRVRPLLLVAFAAKRRNARHRSHGPFCHAPASTLSCLRPPHGGAQPARPRWSEASNRPSGCALEKVERARRILQSSSDPRAPTVESLEPAGTSKLSPRRPKVGLEHGSKPKPRAVGSFAEPRGRARGGTRSPELSREFANVNAALARSGSEDKPSFSPFTTLRTPLVISPWQKESWRRFLCRRVDCPRVES